MICPRTIMVACSGCDGEGQCETGEEYTDPDTGARSAIMGPCELCDGVGGVEVDLEPIEMPDLLAMLPDAGDHDAMMVGCDRCDGSMYEGGPTGVEVPYDIDRRDGSVLTHFYPCTVCGGTGEVEVELEPIELEDLPVMDGTKV